MNEWAEEIVNNRQKSVVTDKKWKPDLFKIEIIYQDRAIVVGQVEANRLCPDYQYRLELIEWSSNSNLVILGTADGQIIIHDQNGNQLNSLQMSCLMGLLDSKVTLLLINKLQLFNCRNMEKCILMKVLQDCQLHLHVVDKDESLVLIDTVITISSVRWSPNGSMFAVAGNAKHKDELRTVVQFYSNMGDYLKTLRVANTNKLNSLSFQGDGLRLIIGVGQTVYFVNLKLDYNGVIQNNLKLSSLLYQNKLEWNLLLYQKIIKIYYVWKKLIDFKLYIQMYSSSNCKYTQKFYSIFIDSR